MKKLLLPLFAVVFAAIVGCSESAPGEDVNAQLKSKPAEERFEMIKNEQYLSLPMKERAIDDLPVDDATKAKWKDEVRAMASGGGTAPNRPEGEAKNATTTDK